MITKNLNEKKRETRGQTVEFAATEKIAEPVQKTEITLGQRTITDLDNSITILCMRIANGLDKSFDQLYAELKSREQYLSAQEAPKS